jgi:homoserine kinase
MALDIWLEAELVPEPGPPEYSGAAARLSPAEDFIHAELVRGGLAAEHRLRVHSDIPLSRGLGSSSAARVAAVMLLKRAANVAVDPAEVFREAAAQEGHPDNAGPAVFGGLVLAAGRPTQLDLDPEVGVALAVPERPVETERARAMLPAEVPRDVVISQAARAAALVSGLARGDGEAIGYGMVDQLAVPHRKQLIPGFDDAVAAGCEAGAYGVTISGSGSTLIALGPTAAMGNVAGAMADALSRNENPATPHTPAINQSGAVLL